VNKLLQKGNKTMAKKSDRHVEKIIGEAQPER
jgi:hypothetical protein